VSWSSDRYPLWVRSGDQATLVDHLVGCGEQRLRDVDAECLCRCAIDGEVENCRLLDRKIGWFRRFGSIALL
jgi:hypothetical protein